MSALSVRGLRRVCGAAMSMAAAIALAGWAAPDSALAQPPKPMLQFPPAGSGNEYVVTRENAANLRIERLVLPDNFTLRVAPDVRAIVWDVGTLEFGANATIDLSAPQDVPAKAADGGTPSGRAVACTAGGPGHDGAPGQAGSIGVSLTFRGVTRIVNSGSLWIRTDGGPGGAGGDGGAGQQGGAPRKELISSHCGAAAGGQGGSGGNGGLGGATADVVIVTAKGQPLDLPRDCQATCGRSQRPGAASGDTGVIATWGGPGCGGAGGRAGPGGLGGESGAPNGSSGAAGGAGAQGACIK
jgi:hypothetical protein